MTESTAVTQECLDERLETAIEVAREAGVLLASMLDGDLEVSKKGRINLVTDADLAAERLILDRLRRNFPGDEILSEEEGHVAGGADNRRSAQEGAGQAETVSRTAGATLGSGQAFGLTAESGQDVRAPRGIRRIAEDRRKSCPAQAVRAPGLEPGPSRRWIVDPLDGTTNFAHGYPFFCVSVALEIDGEIALGTVCDPTRDELFSACRGQGAFLNGRPIRVSSAEQLVDSLLCTGFPYDDAGLEEGLRLFAMTLRKARAVRRDGAAALDLCYVAAGRFEGFWEVNLNPWDVAAGMLIVQEAGGHVTNLDGSPTDCYQRQILATNGRIHGDLSRILTD